MYINNIIALCFRSKWAAITLTSKERERDAWREIEREVKREREWRRDREREGRQPLTTGGHTQQTNWNNNRNGKWDDYDQRWCWWWWYSEQQMQWWYVAVLLTHTHTHTHQLHWTSMAPSESDTVTWHSVLREREIKLLEISLKMSFRT